MSPEFPEITVGQRIQHPELGEGIIASMPRNGFVSVFFREYGERQVALGTLTATQDSFEHLLSLLHPATQAEITRLQLAVEAESLPLMESSAELTAAKIDLLPHQIVLVHRIANADPRRFLIADEVGLGKTIETALILRELASRGEMKRAMMIVPAGLVDNWRHELNDVFHLDFEVFGIEGDVSDRHSNAFAKHDRLIASVDTLKRKSRIKKILEAPPWDLIVFDEAHHLTATRTGNKVTKTLNYKLAEAMREHCRDMLLLSATPHQGDHFRFWMLVRLLNSNLFSDEHDMVENRYRLNAVVIRRTKADACTADGGTLFARRLVHTEAFSLSEEENAFYQDLLQYLQDGYNLAAQQGNKGRALGFVMTIFQKIAASSFAAIRSTLERRRLMLTIQEIIEQDDLRNVYERNNAIDTAKGYIRDLYQLPDDVMGNAETEQILAKMRFQLLRKRKEQETTAESENDYDDELTAANAEESVVFLTAMALPQERERINALLAKYPQKIEAKGAMLLNALKQIWTASSKEKVVIFATYLGTVDAIKGMLELYFPGKGIEVLKGGDQGAKTSAQKRFKRPDGPQVLVCTAAGREGINLQFARVLFNYDLPWNPMDLEQRIGRIHRYGQNATAQVYNLVAANTLEGQIYLLLESKLKDIASALGKVDDHGQVAEDLRGQVLGQLGSQLSYDKLYKDAISDPTLQRTREELDVAMTNADTARKVVFELFQDLDGFNLGDYKKVTDDGRSMKRLISFVAAEAEYSGFRFKQLEDGIVELCNAADGSIVHFTGNREQALADEKLQLFGMEHPIVSQMIQNATSIPDSMRALICEAADKEHEGLLSIWKVNVQTSNGKNSYHIIKIGVSPIGERATILEHLTEFTVCSPHHQLLPNNVKNYLIPARNILLREMEYEGVIPDGASYSVTPLAMILLKNDGFEYCGMKNT